MSILDRPVDFDRLRARLERAVAAVPRLGWRVQPSPGDLGPPIWADDPDFDIDLHVRRIALPQPGTMRQLLDLASSCSSDPSTAPGRCGSSSSSTVWPAAGVRCSRRCTTPSATASTPCACRCSTWTSTPTPWPLGGTVTERVVEPIAPPTTFDTVRGFVEGSFRIPLTLTRQVPRSARRPGAVRMNTLGQEPAQHAVALPNRAINEHGVLRIQQIAMPAQKSPQPLSITAAKIEVRFVENSFAHERMV